MAGCRLAGCRFAGCRLAGCRFAGLRFARQRHGCEPRPGIRSGEWPSARSRTRPARASGGLPPS
ncbi:hypothetical protein [Cryobacterium zhongshanensis]|uniref:hypothetical protein n=1 Tax=Cryobacterium zhongshanensis TaxID=2928153 RepID=UPI0035571DDD